MIGRERKAESYSWLCSWEITSDFVGNECFLGKGKLIRGMWQGARVDWHTFPILLLLVTRKSLCNWFYIKNFQPYLKTACSIWINRHGSLTKHLRYFNMNQKIRCKTHWGNLMKNLRIHTEFSAINCFWFYERTARLFYLIFKIRLFSFCFIWKGWWQSCRLPYCDLKKVITNSQLGGAKNHLQQFNCAL